MDKLENKSVRSTTEGDLSKCPLCSGRLEKKRITHPQQFEGEIVILENVPAEVCCQCGEVLLAPAIVEHLQKVVWSPSVPKRATKVPVYDLTEIT